MKTLTIISVILVFALPAFSSTGIDRDTFSVSIPEKWAEKTSSKLYDKNRHVFFENSESCIVLVMILDKGSGITSARLLEKNIENYKKRINVTKESAIDRWGSYRGNGVLLYGKMAGAYSAYARLFEFETDSKSCLIVEFALEEDWKEFSSDFISIQKTLVIK